MTDAFHDLPLAEADPEVAAIVAAELQRQRATIDMIASENLVPRAVLEAQGSVLTNKYADGYPGARDYDGCEQVDAVERLAVERAQALFGAEHANVQAYSGSSANAAVLHALCEPGDPVLGFAFDHGGHPTHYSPDTFAGRFYRAVAYHVDRATGLVDMDEVAALAAEHRPKVIFAGWSCYPRVLDFGRFREIADGVGARLVVDMAHFAGLVAAGVHPDPVPHADVCTMTVHKTLGGARGGAVLCRRDLAEAVDAAVYPGEQGCPLMHVIAAKAVTFRLAGTPEYRERMQRTVAGARRVAAALASAEPETGVRVLTGGTDVHQVLLDTAGAPFDGAGGMERLHAVGVNGNDIRIPHDARPEPAASGIRLGTAALATRGLDEDAFGELGELLAGVLGPAFEGEGREALAARAWDLIGRYPIYPSLSGTRLA
jgi:glycine hydroxymethyltransferase